jgi:predicted ATPase
MLWSLNLNRQFGGDLPSSLEISNQLMQMAEHLEDGALIMEAHRSLAAALVLAGRCNEAMEHIQKGLVLCTQHRNHQNRVFVSFDSKVMFQCFAAHAFLELGYPDQSAERLAEASALARELGHPQTLVVAGRVAAQLHQLRGEVSQAYERAKEALELADEYGLTVWRAYGLIELGWAEAELGYPNAIARIRQGLADYEATGAKLRTPYFLGLLADQLGKSGQLSEALMAITNAIELADRTGEGYCLAEFHRVQGELFLRIADEHQGRQGLDRLAAQHRARACFSNALEIGRQRSARLWELRAALSMAQLDRDMGAPNHSRLAEVYSSFTEGFETMDLKRAREELNSVSPELGTKSM